MFKANAKYIILGVLVLMLIGAGYVNYKFSADTKSADVADVDAGVISDADSTEIPGTQLPSAAATGKATATAKATASAKATATPEKGATIDSIIGASGSFFASFREQRESTRDKEIEYLDSIINDKNADAESKKDAQDQKIEITKQMEQELTVEGLIRAKGFSDAVVTIHSGSVNVVVKAESLTNAQAAQILDIVRRETGESAENIKIIPNG
jgi:stage III sporulation protein AH